MPKIYFQFHYKRCDEPSVFADHIIELLEVDGINVTSRKFGEGSVMNCMSMQEAFVHFNLVPDCKIPQDSTIHYGHRTIDGAEIYFVSKQTNKVQTCAPYNTYTSDSKLQPFGLFGPVSISTIKY